MEETTCPSHHNKSEETISNAGKPHCTTQTKETYPKHNSQTTRKRAHSLQGGDGEGSSESEDDSPETKRSCNMQDTGPTAPQHLEESVQNKGGPSGALEEEVEASAERSQGIHGPPPSATAEVRVRFPRATGQ